MGGRPVTGLPGNPHAENLPTLAAFSADGSPTQAAEILLYRVSEALLALAYEQRTATLAATHRHAQNMWVLKDTDALDAGSEEEFMRRMDALADQINTRLGTEIHNA